MDPRTFTDHLFNYIWEYKIAIEEFNSFYAISMHEDGPSYDIEDFYAAKIHELLQNLSKDYSFMDNYNQVKKFLPTENRSRIIDFVSWYNIHKNDSFRHIFMELNYGEGYNTDFIVRLMEIINEPPIAWSNQKMVRAETSVETITSLLRRFKANASSLIERRKGKEDQTVRLENEYDIQDLLQVMLKPTFPLTRTEVVSDSKTGREFLKIDFLIPDHKIALECKFIKNSATNDLKRQIADDMITYNEHPDCKELIFFVYDQEVKLKDPKYLEDFYTKPFQFGDNTMNVHLVIGPQ